MLIRCNDPGCKGRSCVVASIQDGRLVLQQRHHGEKHVASIPLADVLKHVDSSGREMVCS